MSAKYTGWLKRSDNGTVEAELRDQWGWRIAITGTFDEQTRQYVLEGRLGEPPAALRVAAIDAEQAA